MQNTALKGSTPTLSSKSAYVSIKDAANYLGVSIWFIHRALKSKSGLPFVRMVTGDGTKPLIRIPKREFLDWIKQNEA